MGFWSKTEGQLFKISVGSDAVVWGFNSRNEIFKKVASEGVFWKMMPALPNLKNIIDITAGSDGNVLACDEDGIIYRWDLISESWLNFKDGRLNKIAMADNSNVVGVNAAGQGYLYLFDEVFFELDSSLTLSDIAIGSDGSIIAVKKLVEHGNGNILRYIPLAYQNGGAKFRDISGNLISDKSFGARLISISNESMIMVLGWDYRIYHYVGENVWEAVDFTDINGNAINDLITDISTGTDGTMMLLTKSHSIYKYIPISPSNIPSKPPTES